MTYRIRVIPYMNRVPSEAESGMFSTYWKASLLLGAQPHMKSDACVPLGSDWLPFLWANVNIQPGTRHKLPPTSRAETCARAPSLSPLLYLELLVI